MTYTRGFVDGEYQDGEVRGLVFLCGRRGMGKTTEMDRILKACSGGRVFFDTLSKHAEVLKGYKVISEPGPLAEYLKANRGAQFRVLYQPRSGNLDTHFELVCRIVRAIGWMIFAVDELDKLCGPRFGDCRMAPGLYYLVNYGRHVRVSMIATARRPRAVARGYTAEAEMRLFNLKERADIDYFEDLIGEENAARLRTLPKYHYLHCSEDGPATVRTGARIVLGANGNPLKDASIQDGAASRLCPPSQENL